MTVHFVYPHHVECLSIDALRKRKVDEERHAGYCEDELLDMDFSESEGLAGGDEAVGPSQNEASCIAIRELANSNCYDPPAKSRIPVGRWRPLKGLRLPIGIPSQIVQQSGSYNHFLSKSLLA